MFIFYPVNTSLQRLLCEIPPRGSKQEKKMENPGVHPDSPSFLLWGYSSTFS